MKRFIILVLGILMFIISCGGTSPKARFTEVMSEIQKGNLQEIERLLPTYKTEEVGPMKEGFSKITYKVNKEEIKGNEAVLNVTIKTPDISPFLQEYMGKMMPLIMEELKTGKKQEDIQKDDKLKKIAGDFFKEKFKSQDLKYVEKTLDIHLKKENGKWILEEGKNEEFLLSVATFGIADFIKGAGK